MARWRRKRKTYRVYTISILFGELVSKWNKLKKAKLFFTTRSKKVPILKKDTVGLVFYSKKDYDKAREILGNPCK